MFPSMHFSIKSYITEHCGWMRTRGSTNVDHCISFNVCVAVVALVRHCITYIYDSKGQGTRPTHYSGMQADKQTVKINVYKSCGKLFLLVQFTTRTFWPAYTKVLFPHCYT